MDDPAAVPPAVAASGAAAVPLAAIRVHGGCRGGGQDGGCGRGGGAAQGHVTGKKNYKNNILINIIEEELPRGSKGWENVATLYQFLSKEVDHQDVKDTKLHWVKKLRNNYKKPTGTMGEPGNCINKCIEIANAIDAKNKAGLLGASTGEDKHKEEDYASSRMEDISFGDREEDDESIGEVIGNVVAVEGGGVNAVAVEGGGGATTAVNAEDGVPMQQCPRLRSSTTAGSSSGGKTKNSSNHDCTSVAKSIQGLTAAMTDRMNSSNNDVGGLGGMAMMQLQMMQQSQMQMQMQLAEMKKQGEQSLKFPKTITKKGKEEEKETG
jgi:hypothetical protein